MRPALSTRVRTLESEYLLQTYARYPLLLDHGKGCYVFDSSGKRYLDFITGIGVNALGHAHPRLTKVIREQAGRMLHCSNLYYHAYQGRSPNGWPKSAACSGRSFATQAPSPWKAR